MAEIVKQMEQVQERGLPNSAGVKKAPTVLNEKNSLASATKAYESMVMQEQQVGRTIMDDVRIMGALQAIKEIIEEGKGITKDSAKEKLTSVKKIIESI